MCLMSGNIGLEMVTIGFVILAWIYTPFVTVQF